MIAQGLLAAGAVALIAGGLALQAAGYPGPPVLHYGGVEYGPPVPPAPARLPDLTWRVDTLGRITAYNAVSGQTDSTPTVASCGPLSAAPARVVAVSRDLFFDDQGRKRCGAEIAVVYADGRVVLGVVWDTMAARYENTADVLMDSVVDAKNHGVATGELHWID